MFGEIEVESENDQRKLKMNNQKIVEKYLRAVDKKSGKQNLYKRCQKLLRRMEQGQTDLASIMKAYKAIDKEVYGICRKAEKSVGHNGLGSITGLQNWLRLLKPFLIGGSKSKQMVRQSLCGN